MVRIVKADLSHLDQIVPLFDAYRQFYKEPQDLEKASTFLKERMEREESIIFLALNDDDEALGFTQLYPTFCSVEARNAFVLYDLFVAKDARRQGVAEKLLTAARDMGKKAGAVWLRLETDKTNIPGQTLYEKLNWERDNDFYTYFLSLDD